MGRGRLFFHVKLNLIDHCRTIYARPADWVTAVSVYARLQCLSFFSNFLLIFFSYSYIKKKRKNVQKLHIDY